MKKVSVAITDDNDEMFQLLGDVVSENDEMEVVGTARDKELACRMIRALLIRLTDIWVRIHTTERHRFITISSCFATL